MQVGVAYHSQRATAVAEATVDINVLLHWELGPARVGETKPQESPERPWQRVQGVGPFMMKVHDMPRDCVRAGDD